MELIELLGYTGALFIGIVLGLIGGGGSILTVPVLVYLMGINPITATAYSLFVVGSSALVGSIKNMSSSLINFRVAVLFGVPSMLAVFATRKWLLPALPDPLLTTSSLSVSKDLAIMVFFALIMLISAVSMIRNGRRATSSDGKPVAYPVIALEGIVVGVITGIVGAGGGFLIIPALVLLGKLPMKNAVATSLVIIAAKSLFGFMGDLGTQAIDWSLLVIFTGISVLGIFIGIHLNKYISGSSLKKGFGWFVLVMAIYIIWRESIHLF